MGDVIGASPKYRAADLSVPAVAHHVAHHVSHHPLDLLGLGGLSGVICREDCNDRRGIRERGQSLRKELSPGLGVLLVHLTRSPRRMTETSVVVLLLYVPE